MCGGSFHGHPCTAATTGLRAINKQETRQLILRADYRAVCAARSPVGLTRNTQQPGAEGAGLR